MSTIIETKCRIIDIIEYLFSFLGWPNGKNGTLYQVKSWATFKINCQYSFSIVFLTREGEKERPPNGGHMPTKAEANNKMKPPKKKNFADNFQNFSNSTTLHGWRYLAERPLFWFDSIFWIFILVVVHVFGLCFVISNTTQVCHHGYSLVQWPIL